MSDNPISDALNLIPYGFYALGSHTADDDNLMVVNWFTQVSFEPQLVAIGLQKTSHTYSLIEKGGVFAVSILRKEDEDAIKSFSKSRAKNPEKMNGAKFTPGPKTSSPVLDAAAAYLECKVVGKLETAGGHDVILGEVVHAEVRTPGEPEDTLTLPDIGWSYAG
ncbi:MAG: flavin reductase family protein [Chloroflexi bacterium]|nr:flavin reductase family protein [Chloroflexota bacterium]MQC26382.1 flavin reductase family protein [Chloroflexota bacterium]